MTSKMKYDDRRQPVMAGYANYFEVGHNAFEFLLDFGQIDPSSGDFNISSRIALGPTHAKLFSRLLEGALSKYEAEFETIPEIRNDDLLGNALDTSPEFERRALDARRRNAGPEDGSSQNRSSKRNRLP